MKKIRLFAGIFITTVLTGCVSLTPSKSAWFRSPVDLNKEIFLDNITMDSLYSTSCSAEELRDTILVIGRSAGINLIDKPVQENPEDLSDGLYMSIYLYENKFTKGLNTYNSVTVTITLLKKTGETVTSMGKTIFTRETASSFNSFKFLHSSLTAAFKHFRSSSE